MLIICFARSCSFAFLLARGRSVLQEFLYSLRTHTHTHNRADQRSGEMEPRTVARLLRRLRRGDSPARHRHGTEDTICTHTRTLTQSSLPDGRGQSRHKRNRHRRTPTPLPRLFHLLWRAAPGGRWPQAKQTCRDLISRRLRSVFFLSGKSGERCITGDSQAQTSIGAGWSAAVVIA